MFDNTMYPTPTEQVDVSADILAAAPGDVDYSGSPLFAIYVGDVTAAGALVYVQMQDDATFLVYDCVKGLRIEGMIIGVGASTTALRLVGLR